MIWVFGPGDMGGICGRGRRAFDMERVRCTGAVDGVVVLTALTEDVGVAAESSVYVDGALESDAEEEAPKVRCPSRIGGGTGSRRSGLAGELGDEGKGMGNERLLIWYSAGSGGTGGTAAEMDFR